jgi:hypothetical protein
MSTLRRMGAVAMTSLVMCAFLAAVPAGASSQQPDTVTTAPEAFVASASARALDLNLLGSHITVGSSGAIIDSSPKAQAQGAGVLLVSGTVANALVTVVNQTDSPPEACVLDLPLLGVLTVAAACGNANATTANGLPIAAATGEIAAIDLGGTLLNPLLQQVGALLGQTVGMVVDPLLTLLGGLLEPLLGALNLNLESLVDELFAGLQRATGVLSVRVGPSASQATTTGAQVLSVGQAAGAVIDVLPGLSPLGAPLLQIIVGDATASVTVTRAAASENGAVSAVATPDFDAAVVRLKLGLPLLGEITDIPVSLGAPITLLAGTPLESTISVGAGSTGTGANGTKFAVADGVSLQLLKGLNGGIGLELAHAEAAGGGQSAVFRIQQRTPVPVPQPELARTGGPDEWLPILGVGLLVAAFALRRLARARS